MAFTGVAVVERMSEKVVRITGLSLAADASGTIGFAGETVPADVSLGVIPEWQPRSNHSLQDLIEVRMTIVTDVTVPNPISVVKTGTTHHDFKATLHNDVAALDPDSGELEIWVIYH